MVSFKRSKNLILFGLDCKSLRLQLNGWLNVCVGGGGGSARFVIPS